MKISRKKEEKIYKHLIEGRLHNLYGHVYRGKFNEKVTSEIMELTETSLLASNTLFKIIKKVNFLMIEMLQNITKHEDPALDKLVKDSGLFVLEIHTGDLFIVTGNLIENSKIKEFKSKLDHVNSLNLQELREYYKKILAGGEISDKGGAGLGLIEIARKSKNNITYHFKKIDKKFSVIYMRIAFQIPYNVSLEKKTKGSTIKDVIEFHEVLNRKGISFIYNGIFQKETLKRMLNLVKIQVPGLFNINKRAIFVIAEVLHNIVKHGIHKIKEGIEINTGTFFISCNKNLYKLDAGNNIENSKVEQFKENLDFVNSLNEQELEDAYLNKLLSFDKDKNSTEIGLLSLRANSQSKIKYNFHKFSDDYSYFSIQIKLKN